MFTLRGDVPRGDGRKGEREARIDGLEPSGEPTARARVQRVTVARSLDHEHIDAGMLGAELGEAGQVENPSDRIGLLPCQHPAGERVLVKFADQFDQHLDDLAVRGSSASHDLTCVFDESLGVVVYRRSEQRFLSGEVGVRGRGREIDCPSNLGDAGAPAPLRSEALDGDLEKPPPGAVALAALGRDRAQVRCFEPVLSLEPRSNWGHRGRIRPEARGTWRQQSMITGA